LLFAFFFVPSAHSTNFYVATNGSDSTGNGSLVSPYATIGQAVTASRAVGKAVQKNIIIRGGSYYNVTVSVEQYADANITFMPYPGETPILYGGQLLTNWVPAGSNNWYVASLGPFPTSVSSVSSVTSWQPRTLLADGVTCTRGRMPATGKYHYRSLSGATLTYTNAFSKTTNMEVIVDKSWSDSEMAVTGINTQSKTLTLHESVSMGPNTGDVTSFALVNLPEAINGDNQFWWDKTNNAIVYRSLGNADPNGKTMIVPTTTRICKIQGYGVGYEITNIVITNLTLAVCNAAIGTGASDNFGENYNAAIFFSSALNCIVDGCTLYGLGGNAVGTENWFNNWNVTVQNCVIHDIGASGIVFPGCTSCTASNNLVYRTGMICQGGLGIRGCLHGGTLITHNTITNTMSAGIAVQGDSTYPNPAETPVITYNFINRAVQALRDMGGIYCGDVSNALIAYNYVGEINGTNSDNGGVWDPFLMGLYNDDGSRNCTWASNVVYNCTRPLIYHKGTNGVYWNNVFVDTRDEATWLLFHNCDRPVFSRNILFSQMTPTVDAEGPTYIPFSVDANIGVQNWHTNMFWSVSGVNSSNPTDATTADPLFLNLRPLDAAFQPNSPAVALRISRLDLNGIGRVAQRPLLPATGLHVAPQ
jgi:hypothetical protein